VHKLRAGLEERLRLRLSRKSVGGGRVEAGRQVEVEAKVEGGAN